ncbi:MAG TPA: hypothetical protein VMV60_16985 [Thermoanaerobaculia bacterium]|nr:hypothetical protein [Thermoanaerobaculia bacterium]
MDDTSNEERWEGVTAAANESEAALIAGFLESRGIPARVVDRSFHQTPTESEDLSGIEIGVPAARVAEAREELARREKAYDKAAPGSDLITDEEPSGG